ncbi:MAG: polyphosphate kinase 2, partial [Mameliella sp.]|nr:polyphosphate kinase 2 [Phaeodactylibacter sp.]
MNFKPEHLAEVKTRDDLISIAKANKIPITKTLNKLKYEAELRKLQSEFVNLQKYIAEKQMRVAILFEGRDAAGKGGSIKRFKEHLNPRTLRVVALTKPT